MDETPFMPCHPGVPTKCIQHLFSIAKAQFTVGHRTTSWVFFSVTAFLFFFSNFSLTFFPSRLFQNFIKLAIFLDWNRFAHISRFSKPQVGTFVDLNVWMHGTSPHHLHLKPSWKTHNKRSQVNLAGRDMQLIDRPSCDVITANAPNVQHRPRYILSGGLECVSVSFDVIILIFYLMYLSYAVSLCNIT